MDKTLLRAAFDARQYPEELFEQFVYFIEMAEERYEDEEEYDDDMRVDIARDLLDRYKAFLDLGFSHSWAEAAADEDFIEPLSGKVDLELIGRHMLELGYRNRHDLEISLGVKMADLVATIDQYDICFEEFMPSATDNKIQYYEKVLECNKVIEEERSSLFALGFFYACRYIYKYEYVTSYEYEQTQTECNAFGQSFEEAILNGKSTKDALSYASEQMNIAIEELSRVRQEEMTKQMEKDREIDKRMMEDALDPFPDFHNPYDM